MIDSSFIDRILKLAPTQVLEIDGRKYTDSQVMPVFEPVAKALQVHTLSGLVAYAMTLTLEQQSVCMFHVRDQHTVDLVSKLFGDYRQRETFISASAFELKHQLNQFMPIEDFIIYLQSMFVPDETTAIIMKTVGNITQGYEMNIADDGMTQRVTAKTGITQKGFVDLPNPVTLRPFRTFVDIEQPASKFILRIKAGRDDLPSCALFEADGGAWKNQAVESIHSYLVELESPKLDVVA